jgi:hypothetical protein
MWTVSYCPHFKKAGIDVAQWWNALPSLQETLSLIHCNTKENKKETDKAINI